MTMLNLFLISSLALVFIGLFGVLTRKNIVKILLSLNIIETGINLLLVAFGYKNGGIVPILGSPDSIKKLSSMVDPVPQALVLTSIVIGLGTTAFALGLTIRYYKTHGTLSITSSEEEEVHTNE
ncbi:Na(+)/H(+) antiporter subunit C1 [Clostridium tepidiprofundi DSM 19306]|uniref:Na(+)/H(+) antiporter subunit C1 n=1 Tax=Clostridium tepidiprofundi DSM 19306 TaxID=1121338 RepID=A0A151B5Z0_9CLOT|nr:cation:proton antiporter subunit C [Clostridium tepidiprofundi]KYH35289.1 Na(+)/H(+) antiporter subunit C1 [Clostridium tepidiprofundi DSM 19306]